MVLFHHCYRPFSPLAFALSSGEVSTTIQSSSSSINLVQERRWLAMDISSRPMSSFYSSLRRSAASSWHKFPLFAHLHKHLHHQWSLTPQPRLSTLRNVFLAVCILTLLVSILNFVRVQLAVQVWIEMFAARSISEELVGFLIASCVRVGSVDLSKYGYVFILDILTLSHARRRLLMVLLTVHVLYFELYRCGRVICRHDFCELWLFSIFVKSEWQKYIRSERTAPPYLHLFAEMTQA